MRRSCPSHLAEKDLRPFPLKALKPQLKISDQHCLYKGTNNHMSLSWVINLFPSAKRHMKVCLGIIEECHTIPQKSSTGCYDLIASEFSAQMNVPDFPRVHSTESFFS